MFVGGFSGFGIDGTLVRDLIYEGIDHIGLGMQHGDHGSLQIFRFARTLQNVIRKAQLHSLGGIHPGLSIHEMTELCPGQPSLDFVGIDDGILHAAQHLNGLLHFGGIAVGNGHGIVDHEHGYRGHQHLGTGHGDNRCSGGRNTVDLDGYIAGIIHQHIVDLGRSHTVATGAVDPNGDITGTSQQFLFEQLGCDIIIKPAFLGDGTVEVQCPNCRFRLRRRLVLPLPELLHRGLSPFRQY